MSAERILVVGGGIAGQAVCEELRQRDADVPLTLVCGEPAAPYDRVRLRTCSPASERRRAAAAPGRVVRGPRASSCAPARASTALDPDAGAATLDDGARAALRHAPCSCTGSDPLLPPLPGIDLPGVHAFRDPGGLRGDRRRAPAARARRGRSAAGCSASRRRAGSPAHGCRDRRAPRRPADGAPARRGRRRAAAAGDRGARRRGAAGGADRRRSPATARSTALRFADGDGAAADLVVVSIGIRAARRARARRGARRRARRSSSTTRCVTLAPARPRGRRVRPAPRHRATGSSRRSTSRRRSRRRR